MFFVVQQPQYALPTSEAYVERSAIYPPYVFQRDTTSKFPNLFAQLFFGVEDEQTESKVGSHL